MSKNIELGGNFRRDAKSVENLHSKRGVIATNKNFKKLRINYQDYFDIPMNPE